MFKKNLIILGILFIAFTQMKAVNPESIYKLKPDDPEALYFTPEKFGFKGDGKSDVSAALQKAINQVKREKSFGILFIPEGKYYISHTIYIPGAVRLIGYGKNRPEFILKKNSPGYQQEVTSDKGKANYMFWFTGGMVQEGQQPRDAGAGTFYSAMSNINLRIEDGNPYAVALRTHYAQHSFVSHICFFTGNGKAGIFDIGNEMENLSFYGGDYGIYTTKSSPGWPVMLVDAYFEGQRKSALRCQESGLAIVNLQVKNVPTVFDIEPNYADRIFVENSRFDNVSGPAIIVSNENNSNNQITLRNIDCRNVPVLALFRRSNTQTNVSYKIFNIRNFAHGLRMDNMLSVPGYTTISDIVPLQKFPENVLKRDIPALPEMGSWKNIRDLGAKGNGVTDDTKVFQDAIDKYDNLYIPQGWYVISSTLRMKPKTTLIGLHPMGTQLMITESSPSFSGFGSPVAILESSSNGTNVINGIGLNTNTYNYRAVALKWMAGAGSLVNDVKFIGGHGSMAKPNPSAAESNRSGGFGGPGGQGGQRSGQQQARTEVGKDLSWDTQYWSFWITNGGGGTFKDIWSASTYATNGLYVSNTSTPSRIYAMSIEHHVRNEARFTNVSNWKIYAFQLEEESRESTECQPVELDRCKGMSFADIYMFRVIRINEPYPYSIRLWNCSDIEILNLHNFSQIKYTTDLPVYDINKDIEVRPWELQQLLITGKENRPDPLKGELNKADKLAGGFDFTEGITRDSKGNIYFCENRMRRIYKWSAETNSLSLVADYPWKPISLGVDTKDNLLVAFRYDPQPGLMVDGKPESSLFPELPAEDRSGTSYSGWGNSGFAVRVYSVNPDNPDETIQILPLVPMNTVNQVSKALYVSNKWRDFHDFNTITVRVPEKCFMATDGKTIIPQLYDLARGSSLLEAIPGKPFYTSDEYDKRMVKCDVAQNGTLSNLRYFTEWGEFGSAVDNSGNLYVADGQIIVFDKYGKQLSVIPVPERPSTIQFGGKEKTDLFITGRSGFFRIRTK
jgi:hypothetical protein